MSINKVSNNPSTQAKTQNNCPKWMNSSQQQTLQNLINMISNQEITTPPAETETSNGRKKVIRTTVCPQIVSQLQKLGETSFEQKQEILKGFFISFNQTFTEQRNQINKGTSTENIYNISRRMSYYADIKMAFELIFEEVKRIETENKANQISNSIKNGGDINFGNQLSGMFKNIVSGTHYTDPEN